MPSKYGNSDFYNSRAWRQVSSAYMSSKLYTCERCGKPAQICHHKKHLDNVNVHDPNVSLSFDNLEALCMDCHNVEHGERHSKAIFNAAGEIVAVKERTETQRDKNDRDQIDDVVARARSLLSVVSCERGKDYEQKEESVTRALGESTGR